MATRIKTIDLLLSLTYILSGVAFSAKYLLIHIPNGITKVWSCSVFIHTLGEIIKDFLNLSEENNFLVEELNFYFGLAS